MAMRVLCRVSYVTTASGKVLAARNVPVWLDGTACTFSGEVDLQTRSGEGCLTPVM